MWVVVLIPILFIGFMLAVILAALSQQREQQRQQRAYWRSLPSSREPLPGEPTCPRCRSGMVRGYLLDRTHQAWGVGMWIEGPPELVGWPALVRRIRLERSIPIASYRCTGCGYLELYARPELVAELSRGKPAGYPEL